LLFKARYTGRAAFYHIYASEPLLLNVHRRLFQTSTVPMSALQQTRRLADGSDHLQRSPATAVQTSSNLDAVEKRAESVESALVKISRRHVIERMGPGAERYLPSEDRMAFLLPDERLEATERHWQKVFVALPWLVFACMLVMPLLLVHVNLPWLEKRAGKDKLASQSRISSVVQAARIPSFEVINFGQMPDVLDRPFPTMVLLFDPATISSKIFLLAFQDVEVLFRRAGIPMSVVALDLSAHPCPPDSFLWQYPRAMTPYLQLILPRSHDGEAGVIDYDGQWSAQALVEAARSVAGTRGLGISHDDFSSLDNGISCFRDALFDLLFVSEAAPPIHGAASARPSWWRRLRGASQSRTGPAEEELLAAIADTERSLVLTGGLSAAAASCQPGSEGSSHLKVNSERA